MVQKASKPRGSSSSRGSAPAKKLAAAAAGQQKGSARQSSTSNSSAQSPCGTSSPPASPRAADNEAPAGVPAAASPSVLPQVPAPCAEASLLLKEALPRTPSPERPEEVGDSKSEGGASSDTVAAEPRELDGQHGSHSRHSTGGDVVVTKVSIPVDPADLELGHRTGGGDAREAVAGGNGKVVKLVSQPEVQLFEAPVKEESCEANEREKNARLHVPTTQPEDESGPAVPISVRQVLEEQAAANAACGKKQCAMVIVFLCVLGTLVFLINSQQERLKDLSQKIAGLGFGGHVIFFFLFLWVGIPIGYSYSIVVILVGFSYGWKGIIDCEVGTVAASTLGHYLGRFFCGRWIERAIKGLEGQKRLYLEASKLVIETTAAGVLMQIVMRLQPIFTFGMMNTFFGAYCRISLPKYIFCTMVGCQQCIVMMTAIGVMVRNLGSIQAASATAEGRANLAINVGVLAGLALSSVFYIRYLTRYVLPRMVSDDVVITTSDAGGASK